MFEFVLISALIGLIAASSHSEAPGTSRNPRSDLSDVYIFKSTTPGFVTMVLNLDPFQQSQAGPNYSPVDDDYVYQAHIDNDGDNHEDLTFQFIFGTGALQAGSLPLQVFGPPPSGLNSEQYYKVRVMRGEDYDTPLDEDDFDYLKSESAGGETFTPAFQYTGRKTFSTVIGVNHVSDAESDANYDAYVKTVTYEDVEVPRCSQPAKVFVGPRRDSFPASLGKVFDLINIDGAPVESLLGPDQQPAQNPLFNDLDRQHVTSIVLEIHQDCLKTDQAVLGFWGSVREINHTPTQLHRAGKQVTRLGNPLVNELLIGLSDKDYWNSQHPSDDGQFLHYFLYPAVPSLVEILFKQAGVVAPTFTRHDLVAGLLQGIQFADGTSFNRAGNLANPNAAIEGAVAYADILRINLDLVPTDVAAARNDQSSLGVLGLDFDGFPNGRRLGDDVVDIVLRVSMGVLCQQVDIAPTDNQPGPFLNEVIGVCSPEDAQSGALPFTDRAPNHACSFSAEFPYLNRPVPGDVLPSDGYPVQYAASCP